MHTPTLSSRRMRILVMLLPLFFGFTPPSSADTPSADWTLLIYMNAKNNLEEDALLNFKQLAAIGSTPTVNLVVELGRPQTHYTDSYGPWSGTLRFHVQKDMKPVPSQATSNTPVKADMASAGNLAKFVDWGRTHYPAKHYALVIWDHGQGWRFKLALTHQDRAAGRLPAPPHHLTATPPAVTGGFRSISSDDDTGHIMYNRDIQNELGALLKPDKLDIIAFDACLMQMVETAYAMRDIALYMVGSEELEPGAGWNYTPLVQNLTTNPTTDAPGLARAIVDSYKAEYGDDHATTLSALDLRQIDPTAKALTTLANHLAQRIPADTPQIRTARTACSNYGMQAQMHNPIDLSCFLNQLRSQNSFSNLSPDITALSGSIDKLILHNYASELRRGDYVSAGISIYFPASKRTYLADSDHDGYDLKNTSPKNHPVEFVHAEGWAPFLHKFLDSNQ